MKLIGNVKQQQGTIAALAFVAAAYLLVTIPYLGRFPVVDWAEMGIAAPAWQLASEGVYGNELFTGFHRTAELNYEYMPAYPLLVALFFEVGGLGLIQGRLASVLCGLAVVFLTFELGRRIDGVAMGTIAALVLCLLHIAPPTQVSGIPLVKHARVIRYDIMVPVFVLASSIVFLRALRRSTPSSLDVFDASRCRGNGTRRRYFWTGILAGLATLAHLYGTFILAVFLIILVREQGLRCTLSSAARWIFGGWVLALTPWFAYVALDPAAFMGQMSRHEGRFHLLDPAFYWNNFIQEYHRYGEWIGGFPEALLQPRIGIWILAVGVSLGFLFLLRETSRRNDPGLRLLLVALPTLSIMLAVLLNFKREVYLLLTLPFMALYVSWTFLAAWRASRCRGTAVRLGLGVLACIAAFESAIGLSQTVEAGRETTPYQEITEQIDEPIPENSLLLISQPYWLGLAHHQTRSLNLLFVDDARTPMEAMMERLNPDFVVVEAYFLDPQSSDPRASTAPQHIARWLELRAFLDGSCQLVRAIENSFYGRVEVHDCRRGIRYGQESSAIHEFRVIQRDLPT